MVKYPQVLGGTQLARTFYDAWPQAEVYLVKETFAVHFARLLAYCIHKQAS